jgi:hypothetical protein
MSSLPVFLLSRKREANESGEYAARTKSAESRARVQVVFVLRFGSPPPFFRLLHRHARLLNLQGA